MSVAASRPPAPVVAPAPLPVPTPADREPDSPPFAELLRQSRGVERRSTEAPKAATDLRTGAAEPAADPVAASDETVPANDGAPKSDAGRARARAATTTPRSTARAAAPAERSDRSAEQIAERGAQDDDPRSAAASSGAANPHSVRPDPTRPVDSDLRFGSAHRPSPAAARGCDAEAGAASTSGAAIDSGAERDSPGRRNGTEAVGRSDTGRSATRARDGDAVTAATSFAQTLADVKAADRPAVAAASVEPPPLPAAAIAAPATPSPSPADSALAPQVASLPVAVDSPEFAAAFGGQVSVFVREGVQHAELHLNPVETGPVSIAITLEGSQAHVEFGADLAATRQAIENGLPALASALRDAGFTLAGGGVAQHSRSGSGQGEDDPAGRGRDGRREAPGSTAIAAAATMQRASHRVAAGGIDLYA